MNGNENWQFEARKSIVREVVCGMKTKGSVVDENMDLAASPGSVRVISAKNAKGR